MSMLSLFSLVGFAPEPAGTAWILPVASLLAGAGAIWAGLFTWLKGRNDNRATAEQTYVENLRTDLASNRADTLLLREELDEERKERRADSIQFAVALNAFRTRDTIWFQHYHRMTEAVIARTGEMPTFPPQLNQWPEAIVEVSRRAADITRS